MVARTRSPFEFESVNMNWIFRMCDILGHIFMPLSSAPLSFSLLMDGSFTLMHPFNVVHIFQTVAGKWRRVREMADESMTKKDGEREIGRKELRGTERERERESAGHTSDLISMCYINANGISALRWRDQCRCSIIIIMNICEWRRASIRRGKCECKTTMTHNSHMTMPRTRANDKGGEDDER